VVRHGAERAEITGTFDLTRTPRELKRWLDEQSITVGDELSIRRVVASDGRSRAYLNGQAVAVTLLREAGNILIDIHGQHEFQSLTRSAAQRELLDGYGRLEQAAGQVGISHRVWLELLNRTLELEGKARDRDAKLELLRYQVTELNALALKDGEFESLVDERARLANRGKLAEATQTALQLLYEGEEGSAHAGVSRALQALRGLEVVDPKLGAMLPLVEEAAIQIREAARGLSHYRDGLELDTTRQDEVERRLAAIEELARKNRVTPLELVARTAELISELETLERAEMDLAVLRKDLGAALEEFRTLAAQLSARRTTAGRALAKDITTRMQTLGMSGGRFQVEVTQDGTAEPAQHGVDQIEFRVTANPGQPLRALAKVASGGELSRLSLAVQVSVAARETRCMVFDEVDSGIGGAVAEIVGRELRALGDRGQVLCVTHLAQVASQGHHHLRVAKSTDGRTTRTALTELAAQDRVEEIARMLGGIEVTGKAREHAREMLRTHLDLPPDPSPTDKMPALTAKDLLAQAKIAAQSAKEAGGVEPKVLGVDPRATAGEAAKALAAGAKPGKAAAAPGNASPGAPQPGKAAAPTAKPTPQVLENASQPGKAAGQAPKGSSQTVGAAASPAKGRSPAAADAAPPATSPGRTTAGMVKDAASTAAGAAQPGRGPASPAKTSASPGKDSPPTAKSTAAAAAKGSADDNVIDLAAKAAARPGAKRR
jgi:DNA repair protein RecN (Recombination protein N)